MAESDETLQLRRRARRRLVGAIALVTFVIIILPLILDKEPGPAGPPLSVQIPSQDSGSFNTRVVPPVPSSAEKSGEISAVRADAPAAKAETAPPRAEIAPTPARADAATAKTDTATAKTEEPAAKAQTKAAPAPSRPVDQAEEVRALAALGDRVWIVSLDAFSNEKNVKQLRAKLSAAGIKSYTEPVKTSKGELTRVRAGPFANKDAAEKARSKLVAMGLRPAAVASQ